MNNKKPRILLTNDDGIYSKGIYALWEAMNEIGEVTVLAPNTEKSAVGHAVTISDPLRIEPYSRHENFKGYAVNGTPADCVKIAIGSFLDKVPNIIVSGINAGSNMGTNILYSGTVSAAAEGTMLGVPSIAFSLNTFNTDNYELSKEVAIKMTKSVLDHGLPNGTLLNVNIPKCEISECQGYKITSQGDEYFLDDLQKREDPRGRIYYWMSGKIVNNDTSNEQDGYAIANNWVSVTPIQYKLTDHKFIDDLKSWKL
tara:strand:+ start:989 stop:1756 length:768 start_codon:yes stop_codon:yes gene_type:complete